MTNIENNYIKLIQKMPIEKQAEYFTINPMMIEKAEIELLGGTHNTNNNGPDGWLENGESIEIKSQIYTGNYKLHGRGKYGSPSMDIYHNKMAKDEKTIFIGCLEDGTIIYKFSMRFSSFAKQYLHAIKKGWGNSDIYPHHYIDDKSFSVQYIMPINELCALYDNTYAIQTTFYNTLIYFHNTKPFEPFNISK